MIRRASVVLALILAIGCGGGDDNDVSKAAAASTVVRAVAWNKEPVAGTVLAVADAGDVVAVLETEAMRVLVNGSIVAADEDARGWKGAASIAAPDGSGTWIAAIDPTGKLRRVRADGGNEDLSARYDLTNVAVTAIADGGDGSVLFAYDGGVAVADAAKVIRYDVGRPTRVAGGGGRFALLDDSSISIIDKNGRGESFAVPGAVAIAVGAVGELFVATPNAVYGERDGTLQQIFEPEQGVARDVIASGKVLWALAGGEVFVLNGKDNPHTSGAALPDDARLIASRSGDVWVLAGGTVRRYTLDNGAVGSAEEWSAKIEPIYTRSCSSCHRNGGTAGIDLSTYDAWVARRAAIVQRVFIERTMPPPGAGALADEERETIRAFIEGN